nr:unnamed protein product [Spirometra erinaceieuropaei]
MDPHGFDVSTSSPNKNWTLVTEKITTPKTGEGREEKKKKKRKKKKEEEEKEKEKEEEEKEEEEEEEEEGKSILSCVLASTAC